MCGITGIYNLDEKPIVFQEIKKMNRVIKHRGPDNEGYILINTKNNRFHTHIFDKQDNDFNLALGHNRLAVYDLSENGNLPMSNEDKTVWITYNGAIYNYIEIRDMLKKRGHKFMSDTDTEVIIHSYEEYGEECVKKFNGVWSFAIWDNNKNKLFISRDRFGVCPIYYFYDGNSFIFSSEIKSILTVIENTEINYPNLYFFLKTYILENSEETLFKGIKILPPAHSLIIHKGKLKIYKYWKIPIFTHTQADKKNEDVLINLLKDAINLRIKCDVPVGVALSGGIDSSTIVCLLNQIIDEPINTFSVVWDDLEYDESHFIKIIEKNTKIRTHFIKPTPNNFFDELQKITWHQEIPTPGPSIYAQWQLMKLVKSNGIKVLLDGQGCDEILAGYPKYFIKYGETLIKKGEVLRLLKEEKKISMTIKSSLLKGILREIFPSVFNILDTIRRKKSEILFEKDFEEYAKQELIEKPHKGNLPIMKIRTTPLDLALYLDLTKNSIPALLHYGDRNSMAFSIQLRNPFLDYRLVELCMNLPFNKKINSDITKYILREKMKNILPEEIRQRKDKKGFPAPIGNWFRKELKNEIKDIIDSLNNRRLFNKNSLENILNIHWAGKKDLSCKIWQLITTEIWFKKFID